MRRILCGLAYAAVALGAAYCAYVWGWHDGTRYHTVESGLSEANVSLSAARSLRARDPQLALELLEANITWVDASLQFEGRSLPEEQRGDYEIVMRRLESYKQAYGNSLP